MRVDSSSPGRKGGTLIAEDVITRTLHERRVCDVDAYRPARCGHCGSATLHVHDYTERKALGDPAGVPVRVVRFVCADDACGATWRVLPAFVARHLWYAWSAIEAATAPTLSPSVVLPVPSATTVARWKVRLDSSARLLVQILAALADAALTAMIATLMGGIDATRDALLVAYAAALRVAAGRRLAALAGHLHRVEPGVRLV